MGIYHAKGAGAEHQENDAGHFFLIWGNVFGKSFQLAYVKAVF